VRRTYTLSETETLALETRLDYLEGAASRLGRVDWRDVLVGTLVSAALTLALQPEPTRDVLFTLLRGIGRFFGHEFPELQGGG
jgi:hypothetical protein